MKQNKKIPTKSKIGDKLAVIFKKQDKLILLSTVVLLFIFCAGYGVAQIYSQAQRERFEQEQEFAQASQQLKDLSDKVTHLELENEQLRESPTPIPSLVPIETTTALEQSSGCDQKKLDAFKKYALVSGYDENEVNAVIEMAKTSGCPKVSQSDKALDRIDDINSKLDRMQMCQSYGVCY